MRGKKATVIVITALVVVSAVLIFLPLAEIEVARDSMNAAPMSGGAFYTYVISVDRNSYSNVAGNVNNYTFPSGVLKIAVTSGALDVTEKIFNSQLTESYSVNKQCPTNSTFAQYFLNNIPVQIGSFFEFPSGYIGSPVKDKSNYQVSYQTSNASLSGLGSKMGVTCPTEILINNVNESAVPSSDKYYLSINRNQMDYDHVGSTNVLVRSFITGNFSLLNMVFHSSGLQYSVYFSLFLVATNVGLHPLDYSYYLSQYAGYLPFIWIISLLILYSVIRSARKRTSRMR